MTGPSLDVSPFVKHFLRGLWNPRLKLLVQIPISQLYYPKGMGLQNPDDVFAAR